MKVEDKVTMGLLVAIALLIVLTLIASVEAARRKAKIYTQLTGVKMTMVDAWFIGPDIEAVGASVRLSEKAGGAQQYE